MNHGFREWMKTRSPEGVRLVHEVLALWAAGWTASAIARKVGCTPGTATGYLRIAGVSQLAEVQPSECRAVMHHSDFRRGVSRRWVRDVHATCPHCGQPMYETAATRVAS